MPHDIDASLLSLGCILSAPVVLSAAKDLFRVILSAAKDLLFPSPRAPNDDGSCASARGADAKLDAIRIAADAGWL